MQLEIILIDTEVAINKSDTTKNKILASLDVIINFYEKNPLFFIIYVNEANGFELNLQAQINDEINDRIQAYFALIQSIFDNGISSDEIIKMNTHTLTLMFIGMVNSLMAGSIKQSKEQPLEDNFNNPEEFLKDFPNIQTEVPIG